MKRITFIIAILFSINSLIAQDFFDKANAFFVKNVNNGLVDYESIKNSTDELDDLVKMIAEAELSKMEDLEKKAFWINAYNISVIEGVINNWPLDNPLNVTGFFDQIKYNIAGEEITLNQLENEKLRPTYNDARLHFVLVCGALGCPKLASFAYTPEKVNQQLQERTTLALNNNDFIQIEAYKRKVYISEIFFWYSDDFKKDGMDFITFINQFRKEKISTDYTVDKYSYDWTINKK